MTRVCGTERWGKLAYNSPFQYAIIHGIDAYSTGLLARLHALPTRSFSYSALLSLFASSIPFIGGRGVLERWVCAVSMPFPRSYGANLVSTAGKNFDAIEPDVMRIAPGGSDVYLKMLAARQFGNEELVSISIVISQGSKV